MSTSNETVSVLACVTSPALGPGWHGALHSPDRPPKILSLRAVEGTPAWPDVLDGLVAGVLPAVMRRGGTLHVRGAVTRGALQRLTEYTEAWHNWRATRFHPVTIVADRIVDDRPAPLRHAAIFAWSGSLRSTHTLIRHLDGLAPAAFAVDGALRVLGLHRWDDACTDGEALSGARQALAKAGVPLVAVRTNAAAVGLIDREIGALPIVAAALHAIANGQSSGCHARSWLFAAQTRYPRPGPALQDLLSGDGCPIRADGGTTAPPRMVHDLLRHPTLAAAVSNCHRRPRHRPPCGRCSDCTLAALAFRAAGVPARPSTGHAKRRQVAFLSLRDPVRAADAGATLANWPEAADPLRTMLAIRLALVRRGIQLRDTTRWLGAAAGLRPVWPR